MGSYCYLGGAGAPLPPLKWHYREDVGGTANIGEEGAPNPAGSGPMFDPLACICMLNAQPSLTELFIMGTDGRIYNSSQTPNNDWSGFNSKSQWTKLDFGKDNIPMFDQKAKFVVVPRTTNKMDVFGVAKDGKVYTTSRKPDTGFAVWTDISGNKRFASDAPIAAVSRSDKQIDVFINNSLAGIATATWNEDTQPQKWTD